MQRKLDNKLVLDSPVQQQDKITNVFEYLFLFVNHNKNHKLLKEAYDILKKEMKIIDLYHHYYAGMSKNNIAKDLLGPDSNFDVAIPIDRWETHTPAYHVMDYSNSVFGELKNLVELFEIKMNNLI